MRVLFKFVDFYFACLYDERIRCGGPDKSESEITLRFGSIDVVGLITYYHIPDSPSLPLLPSHPPFPLILPFLPPPLHIATAPLSFPVI